MCGLPSNMQNSSHKTWKTSLLFLKPRQIQNPKRKRWGAWHVMSPPSEKVGGHVPSVPHQIAPMTTLTQWCWELAPLFKQIPIPTIHQTFKKKKSRLPHKTSEYLKENGLQAFLIIYASAWGRGAHTRLLSCRFIRLAFCQIPEIWCFWSSLTWENAVWH